MYTVKSPAGGGARTFGLCLTAFSLLASIALIGCDSDVLQEPDQAVEIGFGKTLATEGKTRSGVYTFDELKEVGYSVLKRSVDGVSVSFSSNELIPRYTYTLWWVIFDKPEFCTPDPDDPNQAPACGDDDVESVLVGGPNDADISILWAEDGAVAPKWGRKNFSGYLAKDDATHSIFGDGLDNPQTAELHQVLRSHGRAIPGLVEQQITTFDGGCYPGQPNEGQCVDVQFSVHIAQ